MSRHQLFLFAVVAGSVGDVISGLPILPSRPVRPALNCSVKADASLLSLELPLPGVSLIRFSPDGQSLVMDEEYGIQVWSSKTEDKKFSIPPLHPTYPNSLAYSPNGMTLATGKAKIIEVYSTSSGLLLQRLRGHASSVATIAYSPNGKLLFSKDILTFCLWDVESGALILQRPEVMGGTGAAFSPDGSRVVVAVASSTVLMLNANPSQMLNEVWRDQRNDGSFIIGLAYSSDGGRIVVQYTVMQGESYFLVLSSETGKVLLGPITSDSTNIIFSPDGDRVIGSSLGGGVMLWDSYNGTLVKTLCVMGSVLGMDVSSGGDRLAVATTLQVEVYNLPPYHRPTLPPTPAPETGVPATPAPPTPAPATAVPTVQPATDAAATVLPLNGNVTGAPAVNGTETGTAGQNVQNTTLLVVLLASQSMACVALVVGVVLVTRRWKALKRNRGHRSSVPDYLSEAMVFPPGYPPADPTEHLVPSEGESVVMEIIE